MKIVLSILLTLIPLASFGSDDHGGGTEDTSERFGPGKAIEAFDKEQGFKLSEKAIKNLGVKFESLKGPGPWRVPTRALVHIKQSQGIYRRFDGWISLVLVKVVRNEGASAFIRSEDLEPDDEIAAAGSQFLRMTDSDLNAGTVDSCAH